MNKLKRSIKAGVGIFFGLLLSGCSSGFGQSNIDKTWYLAFSAPAYMEVWIETADVVDIQEKIFRGAGGGIASVPKPPNNKGIAKGWSSTGGGGAGRNVTGADLPRLI